MIKREYKKLIQKNREHCPTCALVRDFCICNEVPKIESKVSFILLTHTNELKKRTNTGILIEKSMMNTQIIEWHRKEPSQKLIDIINIEKNVYLLYPETCDDNLDLDQSDDKKSINITNQELLFLSDENVDQDIFIIIIDGTWQEAQKIYNRSEYLKKIKRLSLSPDSLSEYQLRRKKDENHLCTVEAAIITLDMFGEDENSEKLRLYFEKFQLNYKYSQSN